MHESYNAPSEFPHAYKSADRFESASDAAHDASVSTGIDQGISKSAKPNALSPRTEGMQPLIQDDTEKAKWRSFLEARKQRLDGPALIESEYEAVNDPFAYLDDDSPFTIDELKSFGFGNNGKSKSEADEEDIVILGGDFSSEDSLGELVLPTEVEDFKDIPQSPLRAPSPSLSLHSSPTDVDNDMATDIQDGAFLLSSFLQSSQDHHESTRDLFQKLHDESIQRYETQVKTSPENQGHIGVTQDTVELPEHHQEEVAATVGQHGIRAASSNTPREMVVTTTVAVNSNESLGSYSYGQSPDTTVSPHADSAALLAAARSGKCSNMDAVLGASCDRSLLLSRDSEGRTALMLNLLHANGVCLEHMTRPLASRATQGRLGEIGIEGISACSSDLLFELLLSVDNQRASVLQLAVDGDIPNAVQLLVNLPFNPKMPLPSLLTLVNYRLETPLHSAVRKRNDVVLKALLNSKLIREGLLTCDAPETGGCVVNGDGSFALPHGGVVNMRNANGETALLLAVSVHSEAMVRSLLRVASSMDASLPDAQGVTPLMRAVASSAPLKLVQLLLRHPSTCVAQEDEAGNTALSLALSRREMHYLSLLVANRCLPLHKPLSHVRLSQTAFRHARGDHLAAEGLIAASTLRSLSDGFVKLEHPLVALAKLRVNDFTPLVMALKPSIVKRNPGLSESELEDHLDSLRASMAQASEPILSALLLSKERPTRAGVAGVRVESPMFSSLYEASTRAFPLFKVNSSKGQTLSPEWFTYARVPLASPSVHLDLQAPSLEDVLLPPSDPIRSGGFHAWKALRATIDAQRTPEMNICSVFDSDGRSPLWWAAARGRTSLLLRILEIYSAYVDLQATRWEECDPHKADSVGIAPWEAGLHGSHKSAVTALLRLRNPANGVSALTSLLTRRNVTGVRQLAQLLVDHDEEWVDLLGLRENATLIRSTSSKVYEEDAALNLETDPVLLLKTKKTPISALQNPEETERLGELDIPIPVSDSRPSSRFDVSTVPVSLVSDSSSIRTNSFDSLLSAAVRRQSSASIRLVTPDAQWTAYAGDERLQSDTVTHALHGASHAFALAFSGQVPGGRTFVDSYYDSDAYISAAATVPLFAVGGPEWIVMESMLWGGAPRLPPVSQVRTIGVFLQLESALLQAIGSPKKSSDSPLRTMSGPQVARALNLLADRWTSMHAELSARIEEVSPVSALSLQKQARDQQLLVEVNAALASYDPSGEVSEAQGSQPDHGVSEATPSKESVGADVRISGQSFFETFSDVAGRLTVKLPPSLHRTSSGAQSLTSLEVEDVPVYSGVLSDSKRLTDTLFPSAHASYVPWPLVSATSVQVQLTSSSSLAPSELPELYTKSMAASKDYQGEPVQRPMGAIQWASLSRILGVPVAALQFVSQQPPMEALRLAIREELLTLAYEESILPTKSISTNSSDEDLNVFEPKVRPTLRNMHFGSRDTQGRSALCIAIELDQAPAMQSIVSVAASILDDAQALKRTPPSSPYAVTFDSSGDLHLQAHDDDGAWLASDHSQHLLIQAQAIEEISSGIVCAYDRGRTDLMQAILSRAPLAGEYLLTSLDLIVNSAGLSKSTISGDKDGRTGREESLAIAIALLLSRSGHQFIASYPTSALSNAVASLQPHLARTLLRHRDAVEMLRPIDRTSVPLSETLEDPSLLSDEDGSVFFSDTIKGFFSPQVEAAVRHLGQLNLDLKVLRVERRKDKSKRDLIMHDIFGSPAVSVPSMFHTQTALLIGGGVLVVLIPFLFVIYLASSYTSLAPHTLSRWVLRFDFLGLHPLKASGNDLGRSQVKGWFSDLVKASVAVLTGASSILSKGHKRATFGLSLRASVQLGCLLSAVVLTSAVAGRQDVAITIGSLAGLGLILVLGCMRAVSGPGYREVHLCFQELGLASASQEEPDKGAQLRQRVFKPSSGKRGLTRRAGRPTMDPIGVLQTVDEAPQFDLLEDETTMSRRSGGASEGHIEEKVAQPSDDDVADHSVSDDEGSDEDFLRLLNQVGTKAAGAAVEVSSSVARRAFIREEEERAEAEAQIQADARAALRLGRTAPASVHEAAALQRLNRLSMAQQGEDASISHQSTPWLRSKGYLLVSTVVVLLALLTGLASPLARVLAWDYGIYVRSHYSWRFFSSAPFAFTTIEALGCAAIFLLALVVFRPLGLAALLAAHRLQEVQSLHSRLSPVSVAKVTRPADVSDEQRRMRVDLGFCADDGHWMAHVRQQQAATKRFALRWAAVRVVLEPAVVVLLMLGGGVVYVLASTDEANAVRRLLSRSLPGLTLVTMLFACSILVTLTLLFAARASLVASATLRKFEVGVRLCPLGAPKRAVLERVSTLLRESEPRAKFFGVRASKLAAALVGCGGLLMILSLFQALKPAALTF